MTIPQMIRALEEERVMIDRAVQTLRRLQTTRDNREPLADPPAGRGRKFMGPSERLQVSTRMRRYWAERRKQKASTA